ncbi:hypothetical protein Gotur_008952 [Gossypium turneri]
MFSPELNLIHALVHIQLLDRKLIMEKEFLDKVEEYMALLNCSKI